MNLTSRQWALYGYLKANKDTYKTQAQIQIALSDHYPRLYADQYVPFHDTAVRMEITHDIRELNKSDIIQKIIISNKNGVKIATQEEFDQSFNSRMASLKTAIGREYKKLKKAQKDGQTRIVFKSERDVIESFYPDTPE